MKKILCVIPARIGSTRLPRKPLTMLGKKPLIQWAYESAKTFPHFSEVIVATDSPEIQNLILNLGGKSELTPSHMATGSDRVAYVAEHYVDWDLIVNVQGDEPFISHSSLKALIDPHLLDTDTKMSTLASKKYNAKDLLDPNKVKVILNLKKEAIYFSRSPIPFVRQNTEMQTVFLHQGVYAFKRDFLFEYSKLPQTPLEKTELLEQLRAIEHGFKIKVGLIEDTIIDINSPEDLTTAEAYLNNTVN